MKSGLKKDTEGLLTMPQVQALLTRNMSKVIVQIDQKAKIYNYRIKTVAHILSTCEKLDKGYYRLLRYHIVAMVVH